MDLNNPTNQTKQSEENEAKISKEKQLKRKRTSISGNLQNKDTGTLVAECNKEIDNLFEYYKELSAHKVNLESSRCSSNSSLVACLLEESSLAFSKLVEGVYEKLNGKEGVTLAYLRSTVLSVGQRIMYGVAKEDADVLEDESESCLWCWETRDMKLLPVDQRGELSARRLGRKKIHERISALSAMLLALATPEDQTDYKTELNKASTKLGKMLKLEEIRSLVEKKKQMHDTNMAEKAAKLKEKELIREIQKEKLHSEKEIKRAQEESEKEAKRREKEAKRREKEEAEHKKHLKKQQEEAEKNRRREEKEEMESKKLLKKQQEEAEKNRKRREREEAELKKQNSVKKQATILEKFLKTKKNNDTLDKENKKLPLKESKPDSSSKVEVVNTITSTMDNTLSGEGNLALEDFRKLHRDSWRKLRHCNRFCYWGARHNPKMALVKELKLHELSTSADSFGKGETTIKEVEPINDKLVDGSEKSFVNNNAGTVSIPARLLRKKLLQFDKSNRPAYYGSWSKKSCAVGPRHPFKKDPNLDYDVDSDEEWEEEEPGESLSDCEKDTDEEHLEEENFKIEDGEESEDDFFVPDGYLSENEGVQIDGKSNKKEETLNPLVEQSEIDSEEIRELLQQQKYLLTLTEQALRKGHPLIITNLMHEKSETNNTAEEINGNWKMDNRCLQALCMQSCSAGIIIDLSLNQSQEYEDQEVPESQNKGHITPSPPKAVISDSDLLEYVKSIRSNSQGINKVVESLHAKFPSTSKTQLRNKVKDISEYVDNRWQVKSEILAKLGLSITPEKSSKPRGIASFFLKRCHPPK